MATSIEFAILAKDRASKVFRDIGRESEKSTTKMEKFHKVGHASGVALAGGLTLMAAASVKATKAAAEDQQSQSRLAQTLVKATGATKAQRAEVESWITAQGKAYGVADDQLRPALSKLAVATGSVTKAQKLASLAMDVSAGTGKSLESVAFALAKAQNGNVSGLARLGVQTTKTTGDTMALEKAQTAVKSAQLSYTAAVKAHGKGSAEAGIALDKLHQAEENVGAAREKTKKTTLSLDTITKNLSNTYGGAAAKNAQTAAGKQKILQVQMSELTEQIGYALIPVMNQLMQVGIKVVGWVSNNTRTVGILVGILGGLAAVTWAVSAATKAWFAITKIAAVTTKAFAAAQWLLNVAMDANPIGLVVIAIAALVAGLVIAYKHSATFRAIVQGAFHGVANAAKAAFGWIKGAASTVFNWLKGHWKLIASILGGPVVAAAIVIMSHWSQIKAGASAVFGAIKGVFSRVLGVITAPFRAAISIINHAWDAYKAGGQRLLAFVSSLPGKIAGAIGNLSSLLYNAGRDVVQGLINGMGSMAGSLASKAKGLAGGVSGAFKGALGIHSPSRVFIGHGRDIMRGLIQGIESQQRPLSLVLDRLTAAVKAAGDKLKSAVSARNSFASGFSSFGSSIFGADYGQDANGNAAPVTIGSILAKQQADAAQAAMLKANIRKLVKMGLSPALIKQLQSAGAAGIPEIQALASGSKSDIQRVNALNKQTSGDLHSAGMAAANSLYGASIRQDREHYRQERHLLAEIRDAVKGMGDKSHIEVHLDGQHVDFVLAKRKRVHGKLQFEKQ